MATYELKGKKHPGAQATSEAHPVGASKYEWMLYYHLSQGFDVNRSEGVDFGKEPAVQFMGVAQQTTASERNTWDFGILQFAKVTKFQMKFRGFSDKEGAIDVDVSRAPSFRRATLDTPFRSDRFPFCNWRQNQGEDPVIVQMRDHPNGVEVMRLLNAKTGFFNYLHSFKQSLTFTVVQSARSKGSSAAKWQHFRTGTWSANWNIDISWAPRNGVFTPTMINQNSLTVTQASSSGTPTDGEVNGLLGRINSLTKSDTTNSVMGKAVKEAKLPTQRREKAFL